MKKLIVLSLLLILISRPVEARRKRPENFFNQPEKTPTNAPSPTASPTALPTPTPKPAIMFPNDSAVRTFLIESTYHPVTPTPHSATSSALKLAVKPLAANPPDQMPSMIASFIAFIIVAFASYRGFFDRGFFKRL